MPRFGLKSLLIGVTLVALWCSTFSGYTGAEDVRAFVMTAALVASGVAAYSYRARWRAFWLGFFGTMLVTGGRQFSTLYGLRFGWSTRFARDVADFLSDGPPLRGDVIIGIHLTAVFVAMLIAATLIGLVCVHVYDQARRGEIQ